MAIEYIAEKKFADGSKLKLKTWVSDVICSDKRMHQLELVTGNPGATLTTQFPTDYENYSEIEIREMYDLINSKHDFKQVREERSK